RGSEPMIRRATRPRLLTLFKVACDSVHNLVPPVSSSVRNRVGSDVGGEQTCPWHTNATGPAFASLVLSMGSTGGGTYVSSRSTTHPVFPPAFVPVACL